MGFKTAATADPFDLQEIATVDGILADPNIESLTGWSSSTTGTGSVTQVGPSVDLATGTTADSSADLRWQPEQALETLSWDADRTVRMALEVFDTDGPLWAGTGRVFETNFTFRHAMFKWVGGNLVGSVADGSTEATTTLQTSPATSQILDLRIEYTAGTDVEFFVDGTSEGTVSSNLPSGTTNAGRTIAYAAFNTTATNRSMSVGEARTVQHA